MKILVADPNHDVAHMVKVLLEGLYAASVIVTTSSDSALIAASEFEFDSFLIDLALQPAGGLALRTALGALPSARPQQIAVAWYASIPDQWRTLPNGFNCFLLKPASVEHMWAALHGECCKICHLPYDHSHTHSHCR